MERKLKSAFFGAWATPETLDTIALLAKLRRVRKSELLRQLVEEEARRAAGQPVANGQKEPVK
jgi:hypothetical protein